MSHRINIKARRDFSFRGRDYRAGEVFDVAPIDAVLMGLRNVSLPPNLKPEKRRRKKTMAAPEPDGVAANPDAHLDANTYERKDLRAED